MKRFWQDIPSRCRFCGFHPAEQGHRSQLPDGTRTGCSDEGPLGLALFIHAEKGTP